MDTCIRYMALNDERLSRSACCLMVVCTLQTLLGCQYCDVEKCRCRIVSINNDWHSVTSVDRNVLIVETCLYCPLTFLKCQSGHFAFVATLQRITRKANAKSEPVKTEQTQCSCMCESEQHKPFVAVVLRTVEKRFRCHFSQSKQTRRSNCFASMANTYGAQEEVN